MQMKAGQPRQRKKRTIGQVLRPPVAGLLALLGVGLTALAAGVCPPGLSEGVAVNLPVESAGLGSAQTEETAGAWPGSRWQKLLWGDSALLTQFVAQQGETSHPDGGSSEAVSPPEKTEKTEKTEETEQAEQQPPAVSPDQVKGKTITGTGSGYVQGAGVSLFNRTEKTVDLEAAAAGGTSLAFHPAEEGPQILIMHTHATESYARPQDAAYQETGVGRTTDTNYNVVRVGAEMARIFEEQGLSVLHLTELYDYPSYNEAYERSKAGIEQVLQQYPTIQMVLDVHRDALVGEDGTVYKPVVEIDGTSTAQVMLLVGSDDAGGYFPDWQEHLALAIQLQKQMNTLWPGLARPITLRTARFNQQLTKGSLLVEVGSHGNTLEEALAGARLFARAVGGWVKG